MGWIGAPTAPPARDPAPGWTGAPAAVEHPPAPPGWIGSYDLTASASGLGIADATLIARLDAIAAGQGIAAAELAARVEAAALGVGIPAGAAAYAVLAEAIGQGLPSAAAAQVITAAATGTGAPSASAIAKLVAAAAGTGTPSASAVDVSPYTTAFETPSTTYQYNAPLAYSTFDLVGIGGGGGGDGTGPFSSGRGGARGVWNSLRLVRGVNFSATATTITVYVGDGGSTTFAYYTSGGNGDVVRFTYLNQNGASTTLTCNGGAGGGASNSTGQATSPNPYVFQGQSYVGGTGSSSNPGSGGNGAPYGTILSQFGARGRAWIRASP